jgi:hypothetical protein
MPHRRKAPQGEDGQATTGIPRAEFDTLQAKSGGTRGEACCAVRQMLVEFIALQQFNQRRRQQDAAASDRRQAQAQIFAEQRVLASEPLLAVGVGVCGIFDGCRFSH